MNFRHPVYHPLYYRAHDLRDFIVDVAPNFVFDQYESGEGSQALRDANAFNAYQAIRGQLDFQRRSNFSPDPIFSNVIGFLNDPDPPTRVEVVGFWDFAIQEFREDFLPPPPSPVNTSTGLLPAQHWLFLMRAELEVGDTMLMVAEYKLNHIEPGTVRPSVLRMLMAALQEAKLRFNQYREMFDRTTAICVI